MDVCEFCLEPKTSGVSSDFGHHSRGVPSEMSDLKGEAVGGNVCQCASACERLFL